MAQLDRKLFIFFRAYSQVLHTLLDHVTHPRFEVKDVVISHYRRMCIVIVLAARQLVFVLCDPMEHIIMCRLFEMLILLREPFVAFLVARDRLTNEGFIRGVSDVAKLLGQWRLVRLFILLRVGCEL